VVQEGVAVTYWLSGPFHNWLVGCGSVCAADDRQNYDKDGGGGNDSQNDC
jgi:hypothetical protein